MFTLESVVPWGRSFQEYQRMFSLTDVDLRGRILGCADGPASFNIEATRQGMHVISCDPIYQFEAKAIRARIDDTYVEVLRQTTENRGGFIWTEFATPEAMGQARMNAMTHFLDDFETGRHEGRYLYASLPSLSFEDGAFDLAVCSHFLFLYSEQMTEQFHVRSILELARVASELRIFPLIALDGKRSPHVSAAVAHLEQLGLTVTEEHVPYEFVRGANQMLRARRPSIDESS